MRVFVVDRNKTPLMPCHPARARKLLRQGRARVHRRQPFTIRLVDRDAGASKTQPIELKVDPGASVTGLALVRQGARGQHVLWLAELAHRGGNIRRRIRQRRQFRRARRARNVRHRKPRFNNRRRPAGWLAPSVASRRDNVIVWADRLMRWVAIAGATVERVRFDTQAIANPDVSGTDYHNGPLAGWEAWEFLLQRDGHRCVYCDATGVRLEQDHVVPRSKGGSDRPGNLVVACHTCNQTKGNQDLTAFLAHEPDRLKAVRAKLDTPLGAVAAVNATRKQLPRALRARGLAVRLATGGQTRANRTALGLPKCHALDAACAGHVERLTGWQRPILAISATGRGSYQRTRLHENGFPRGYLMRQKQVRGLQTGDLVRADVTRGKKAGRYIGRVAVRRTGFCNVETQASTVQGIHARYITIVQRADGYSYAVKGAPSTGGARFPPRPQGRGLQREKR